MVSAHEAKRKKKKEEDKDITWHYLTLFDITFFGQILYERVHYIYLWAFEE